MIQITLWANLKPFEIGLFQWKISARPLLLELINILPYFGYSLVSVIYFSMLTWNHMAT